MATTYSYTKVPALLQKLYEEILIQNFSQSIISINEENSVMPNLHIVFNDNLLAGEVATLGNIVDTHTTANFTLDNIDFNLPINVISADVTDPSSLIPNPGDIWLINGIGAGDWLSHNNQLAQWSGVMWRYSTPTNALEATTLDRYDTWIYDSSTWILASGKNLADASEVFASTLQSTVSTEYTLLNNMAITPPKGTYLATFSGELYSSTNGYEARVAIFIDNAIQVASERVCNHLATGANHDHGIYMSSHTQTLVTVNGTQSVNVRWRSSNIFNSIRNQNRNLILVRVK